MIELIISNLVGIFIGIVASLLAWWVLFHFLVPTIRFSSSISKTPDAGCNSRHRYRIKLENAGRRAVIDVELFARFRLRGASPEYPENWVVVDLPLDLEGRIKRIPRIRPTRRGARRDILEFAVHRANEFRDAKYPEHIRQKAERQLLTLEDILNLASHASVQIEAFGYDEYSGTRKFFVSKSYCISDIKPGRFAKDGLEIRQGPPWPGCPETVDSDTKRDINTAELSGAPLPPSGSQVGQ